MALEELDVLASGGLEKDIEEVDGSGAAGAAFLVMLCYFELYEFVANQTRFYSLYML